MDSQIKSLVCPWLSLTEKQGIVNHIISFDDSISKFYRCWKYLHNHLAKLAKWLRYVVRTYLYGKFDCIFYHLTHVFTLYSCLNVKELLARNRCDIWSLGEYNGICTLNYLDGKQTLNDLAKLTKWMDCVVSTYLYGVLDCMFLRCHFTVYSKQS